jgi:hypothetical protein
VNFIEKEKGDHSLYIREFEAKKRIVPIDMGPKKCPLLMFYEFLDNLVSPMKKLKFN